MQRRRLQQEAEPFGREAPERKGDDGAVKAKIGRSMIGA